MGAAARAYFAPRVFCSHPGHDPLRLAHSFGLAAAPPTHLPFGFTVPNLTSPNALIEARAKFTHEIVSKLLIAAIGLHVAAALKHQFVDHDGVLLRMLPFGARLARRRI